WMYTFDANGGVSWLDPFNGKTGKGTWSIRSDEMTLSWTGSATKETWKVPLAPGDKAGSGKVDSGKRLTSRQRARNDSIVHSTCRALRTTCASHGHHVSANCVLRAGVVKARRPHASAVEAKRRALDASHVLPTTLSQSRFTIPGIRCMVRRFSCS